MSDPNQIARGFDVGRMRQEHADLDMAIEAMRKMGCDTLAIQRLKKKKLGLKDRISALEDQIVPDIIA